MILGDRYADNAKTTALLMDAGIELMRQNLKRRNPRSSEREIDDKLSRWLCRADDPVPGDVAGAVRVRERVS